MKTQVLRVPIKRRNQKTKAAFLYKGIYSVNIKDLINRNAMKTTGNWFLDLKGSLGLRRRRKQTIMIGYISHTHLYIKMKTIISLKTGTVIRRQ